MNKQKTIFSLLVELEQSGNPGALCMVTSSKGSTPRRSGAKMIVYEDGSIAGTVGGGELENRVRRSALESMKTGRSITLRYNMTDIKRGDPGICGGQVEVYVEPILPAPTILIIGSGHVGKAVSRLAKWLGYRVVVSDDRPEFCTRKANPDADLLLPIPMKDIPGKLKITSHTFIVLTTRGVDVDVEGLPVLIESQAAYIGVIGSRKRWTATTQKLLSSGVSKQTLQRIHSPIGIEINAETPEEIAVSILAEIIMVRNGGTGKPLKASNRFK
jgi:xanthine dehydrogenase accessory factor